jgi:hypothetical protein
MNATFRTVIVSERKVGTILCTRGGLVVFSPSRHERGGQAVGSRQSVHEELINRYGTYEIDNREYPKAWRIGYSRPSINKY